ncbi:MAG: ABC transporter C-terminal domain-containing protein, partial [Levilactobacillus brevis]
QQKAKRKLSRQVDALEEQLAQLETEKSQIETAMSAPENFNDVAKLADLQAQLTTVTTTLAQTEDDWTEKSLALENFAD